MTPTVKSSLSTHRQPLMGIAISMIMICHNRLWFWDDWANNLNFYIQNLSSIGVEIFLFCSGYGLFFSYMHSSNLGHFYKKRIVRILPVYLAMGIVWGFFAHFAGEDVIAFLDRYSLFSFFIKGEIFFWFIPAIITLYLLYPVAVQLTQSGRSTVISCAIIWLCSFAIVAGKASFITYPVYMVNIALTVRIPVFLLGVYWAQRQQRGSVSLPRISPWLSLSGIILLIGCFIVNVHVIQSIDWWWANRLLFCPLTLCLLALLLTGLERIEGSRFYRGLSFLGSITLELYLIHERLQDYLLTYILVRHESRLALWTTTFFSIVLAIGIAWGVSKLCTLPFRRKSAPEC